MGWDFSGKDGVQNWGLRRYLATKRNNYSHHKYIFQSFSDLFNYFLFYIQYITKKYYSNYLKKFSNNFLAKHIYACVLAMYNLCTVGTIFDLKLLPM